MVGFGNEFYALEFTKKGMLQYIDNIIFRILLKDSELDNHSKRHRLTLLKKYFEPKIWTFNKNDDLLKRIQQVVNTAEFATKEDDKQWANLIQKSTDCEHFEAIYNTDGTEVMVVPTYCQHSLPDEQTTKDFSPISEEIIISEELKRIEKFIGKNPDLVQTCLNLVATTLVLTLNTFNAFDYELDDFIMRNLSFIPEYRKKELEKRIDNPHYFIAYGVKIDIVQQIFQQKTGSRLTASDYKILKSVGYYRNDLLHSVYGIDIDTFEKTNNNETPLPMIISPVAGKVIGENIQNLFNDFQIALNHSRNILKQIEREMKDE